MGNILWVQIIGAYRASTVDDIYENIYYARTYGKLIVTLGYYVYIPHCNTAFMDGVVNDDHWLNMGIDHLKFMDAVFLMPGWELSEGSVKEVQEAKRLKLIIFETIEDIPSLKDETSSPT